MSKRPFNAATEIAQRQAISQICDVFYVKDVISRTVGEDQDLIIRDDCFVIRDKNEGSVQVERIIILPPHGFTANEFDQMNSHDEALSATIEILGSVREGKRGFSRIKDCLRVISSSDLVTASTLSEPYLTFDDTKIANGQVEHEIHSAGGSPFHVVKPDGYGFYHNLINKTDEWLVLKLKKNNRPAQKPNVSKHVKGLQTEVADKLVSLHAAVEKCGDDIYNHHLNLVNDIASLPPEMTLPALTDMLYIHDTGRHEACSVFGVILKIGKQHPEQTLEFLQEAKERLAAPSYYLEQLAKKIQASTKSPSTQRGLRRTAQITRKVFENY